MHFDEMSDHTYVSHVRLLLLTILNLKKIVALTLQSHCTVLTGCRVSEDKKKTHLRQLDARSEFSYESIVRPHDVFFLSVSVKVMCSFMLCVFIIIVGVLVCADCT